MAKDRYENPGGVRPTSVDVHLAKITRAWNATVSFTRDGNDNITLITETDGEKTYTQTWTWSGTNLTSVGPWVEV